MENVLVVEEFCKADSGLGMAIHLGYIPSKFVKVIGTTEQKNKYLAPWVKGDWVSAVAFTEPDHGSDLNRMETTLEERGRVCPEWDKGFYHKCGLRGLFCGPCLRGLECTSRQGDDKHSCEKGSGYLAGRKDGNQ